MVQGSLKARQMRAARALLDWSQDDLADAANLSVATIRKLELGYISPRLTTTKEIRQSFEDAGLEFIEPDGVRFRPDDIKIYQGVEGLKAFFDDLYNHARQKGGEYLCVCETEEPYLGPDGGNIHTERMTKIKDTVSVKCIITGENRTIYCAPYSEYRWLSRHYVNSVPFYVYDDKYAIFVFEADPSPKITVIQSRVVAEAFRQQFYSMWGKATPLNTAAEKKKRTKTH